MSNSKSNSNCCSCKRYSTCCNGYPKNISSIGLQSTATPLTNENNPAFGSVLNNTPGFNQQFGINQQINVATPLVINPFVNNFRPQVISRINIRR